MTQINGGIFSGDYLDSYQQASHDQAKGSVLWRGLIVTASFAYESLAAAAGFIIPGLALRIFFPALSIPFFGVAGVLLPTRLVLKTLKVYNITFLHKITKKASDLTVKYPNIQLITFIFAVAISALWTTAGLVIAINLGILSGILLEVNLVEKRQKMNKANSASNPALERLLKG